MASLLEYHVHGRSESLNNSEAVNVMLRQGTQLPATIAPSPGKYCCDLSGVDPVEQDHNKKHEDRIEEVEVCLVSQKIPVKTLKIFDGTEYRANHDQKTSKVQRPHVFPPGDTAVGETGGRCVDRMMKGNRKNDEESEADKLDEETDDDDLGAIFKGF